MHAAGGAEGVFGAVCVEGVGGERVMTSHQLELTQRNDEVFVLLLNTDAAAVTEKEEEQEDKISVLRRRRRRIRQVCRGGRRGRGG